MNIVVACDSFKGTLTADAACACVARGLRRGSSGLQVVRHPLADGGEGSAAVIRRAGRGTWRRATAMGPLPPHRRATRWLWLPDEQAALVELAAINGLTLLARGPRQPLLTTTFGTGELIRKAAQSGARHIYLAVGGSASVDGGGGAATALGWQFLDARGRPVPLGGGGLARIRRIVRPPHVRLPAMTVLCDVTNPLCGPRGAATVFGPQKGATPAMVTRLAAGLENLAGCMADQLGQDVRRMSGGGAAGGMGAGARGFFNARLTPGIAWIMAATRFEDRLAGADWVITGEGRLDSQSWHGKVVSGVVNLAHRHGVAAAVLAGDLGPDYQCGRLAGARVIRSARPAGMSPARAMAQAGPLLEQCAAEFAREFLTQGAA